MKQTGKKWILIGCDRQRQIIFPSIFPDQDKNVVY